jgi:hypothetical protein
MNPNEIETERRQHIAEMAADAGEDWAKEYAPGSPGCHELLDRAALAADIVERHVVAHPACVANPEWYALAERAAAALRDLYQSVGKSHLSVELRE